MSKAVSTILHCGGKPADFAQVCNVELPEATDTYRTVPHGDLIRLLKKRMEVEFDLIEPNEQYGLNREGKQLFGSLAYDLRTDHKVDLSAFDENGLDLEQVKQVYGFAIAFRNSYDRSMSAAVAGGTHCFICDNLSIHGSAFTIIHPHTKNVWDFLVPEVMKKVAYSSREFIATVKFQESMKEKMVTMDVGYKVLGLARGRGIFTPGQYERAIDVFRAIQKKDHPFYPQRRNAYGLYQSFTDGLKMGSIYKKIDRYTGASDLFEELDLAPKQMTVV
jgi:hypothetical protein